MNGISKKNRIGWQIPKAISEELICMQKSVEQLSQKYEKYNRKFTLDGRLIGDIGEVLAAHFIEIVLDENQRKGIDASTKLTKESVQIKCPRKSDRLNFSLTADYLIVLKIEEDNSQVTLRYVGRGNIIEEISPKKKSDENGNSKRSITLNRLEKRFNKEEFKRNPPIPLTEKGKEYRID